MNTGDHHLIKNLNKQIIIEKIIENKDISRAQLSKITGLNKATVTTQIAELLRDEIVIETRLDKSTGGRKAILLTLNRKAAYAIGIDVDRQYINFLVTDLTGNIIHTKSIDMDTSSFEKTKEVLKEEIRFLMETVPDSRYGIVGIGIGIHGIVDQNEEIIYAAQAKWKNVRLKEYLSEEFNVPIFIDNNTNFCAYAEKAFYVNDSNVLCLTTSTGIGLGIIINNTLYKGLHGFAGEIGHMITKANGRQCGCGNQGCWELYASDRAFLTDLAVKKKVDRCTLDNVQEWIINKDTTTLAALKELAENLSIGINNVINIFNPETIILNSQIISMYPALIQEIEQQLHSDLNDYKTILYSQLGKDACVLGACAVVIKEFLKVSDLQLMKQHC